MGWNKVVVVVQLGKGGDNEMIGIREIKEYFGVSNEAVRKHMKRGTIKGIKFGNLWKITEDEFTRIKREGVVLDKRADKS